MNIHLYQFQMAILIDKIRTDYSFQYVAASVQ